MSIQKDVVVVVVDGIVVVFVFALCFFLLVQDKIFELDTSLEDAQPCTVVAELRRTAYMLMLLLLFVLSLSLSLSLSLKSPKTHSVWSIPHCAPFNHPMYTIVVITTTLSVCYTQTHLVSHGLGLLHFYKTVVSALHHLCRVPSLHKDSH